MIKKLAAVLCISTPLFWAGITAAEASNIATLVLHIVVQNPSPVADDTDCIYYAIEVSPSTPGISGMTASIRYISTGKSKKIRTLTAMLDTETPVGEGFSMYVKPEFPASDEEIPLSTMAHDLFTRLFEAGTTLNTDLKYRAGYFYALPAGKSYKVTYTLADIS